jgi:hypothetical protein
MHFFFLDINILCIYANRDTNSENFAYLRGMHNFFLNFSSNSFFFVTRSYGSILADFLHQLLCSSYKCITGLQSLSAGCGRMNAAPGVVFFIII